MMVTALRKSTVILIFPEKSLMTYVSRTRAIWTSNLPKAPASQATFGKSTTQSPQISIRAASVNRSKCSIFDPLPLNEVRCIDMTHEPWLQKTIITTTEHLLHPKALNHDRQTQTQAPGFHACPTTIACISPFPPTAVLPPNGGIDPCPRHLLKTPLGASNVSLISRHINVSVSESSTMSMMILHVRNDFEYGSRTWASGLRPNV